MANNDDILKAADRESKERLRQIDMVTSNVSKLRAEINRKMTEVDRRSTQMSTMTDRSIAKLSTDLGTIKKGMARQNSAIQTIGNQKGIREVQTSVNTMMKTMSKSVDYLARGVRTTSAETMRMTKNAIGQYGKAISEDISINKQNTIAMAMAKSSPLFGYFASKFMETEVYSEFTDKIKQKFSDAFKAITPLFTGIFRQLGEKLSNLRYLFARKPKIEYSDESLRAMGNVAATVRGYGEKAAARNNKKKKIPHLASGGTIKKSGLAKVHKGEVVMPMDELLREIDRKAEQQGDSKLARTFMGGLTVMSQDMANIEKYVARAEMEKPRERKGLARTFVDAFKKAKDSDTLQWQERLLRATLELKTELVGSTDRMKLAWQETLIQHPTFRNILALTKGLHAAFTLPLRYLFAARGGFMGLWRKATRSKNIFQNMVSGLGLMYTQWSPKFDLMAKSLSQLSDEEYKKAATDKTHTQFDKLKAWVEGKESPGGKPKKFGETLFTAYTSFLGLDKAELDKAGITTFSDMNPKTLMEKAGVSKKVLQEKWRQSFRKTGADVATSEAKAKLNPLADVIKDRIDDVVFDATFALKGIKKGGVAGAKLRAQAVGTRIKGVGSKVKQKISDADKKKMAVQAGILLASGGWSTGMGLVGEGGSFNKEEWARKKQSVKDLPDTLKGLPEEFRKDPKGMLKKSGKFGLNHGLTAYMLGSRFLPRAAKGGVIHKTGKLIGHKGEVILPLRKVFELINTFARSTWALVQKLNPLTKLGEIFKKGQSKFPFQLKSKLADSSKIGTKLMGVYSTILQKKHEFWARRTWKKEVKLQKETLRERERFARKFEKIRDKSDTISEKARTKLEKRSEKFYERSENLRNKSAENTQKRQTRWEKIRARVQQKFDAKVDRMREYAGMKAARKQAKVLSKYDRLMHKDRVTYAKKARDYKKQLNDEIIGEAKALQKHHRRTMTFYRRLHGWFAGREERRQKRMEKSQQKIANQREKIMKKTAKIREKIEKDKLKFALKLERAKAKQQGKAARRLQKMKLKLDLQKQKIQAKKDQKKNRIKLKLDRERMKVEAIQMKKKWKIERANMKIETKKMKEQLKEEKKTLKKERKAARKERRQARMEYWSKRWEQIREFPKSVEKFRSDARNATSKQYKILKDQRDSLSTIRGVQLKMKKVFPTFTRMLGGIGKGIKKLGGGFLKYLMMGFSFLSKMVGPGIIALIKWLPAIAISLGQKALGGIGSAVGGIGSRLAAGGAGAFAGAAAGVGGLAWGAMDAYKGVGKAKEWGTSKTGAGIGGFLGGTEEQFSAAGAMKGAGKGAMIGAGIGTLVGGPFGTAIGGAIGAIAGGILGFVGGQNIAKAMDWIGNKIKSLVKGVVSFITWPYRMMWKALQWAKDKMISGLSKIPFIGKYIKKWAVGEKTDDEKFEEAKGKWAERNKNIKTPTMQRGGIVRHPTKANLHGGEVVVPLPPGVAETMARSVMSPSELAKRQAGMDIARTRAGVNPLLASDAATRNSMGQGNGAVVTSVNNIVSAVSANNSTASTTANSGVGGGAGMMNGGIDYASQVVMGDIG